MPQRQPMRDNDDKMTAISLFQDTNLPTSMSKNMSEFKNVANVPRAHQMLTRQSSSRLVSPLITTGKRATTNFFGGDDAFMMPF